MYRFMLLPACLLLVAGCNQASAPTEAPALDSEQVEQMIADYIQKNPGQIAQAVAIAAQAKKASVVHKLADQGNLVQLGPSDAPITIIEFFDYNCGYCRRALDWLIEQLDRKDVRVIFVEAPLLDPRTGTSKNAALASLAAAQQQKFQAMHEALMQAESLEADAILNTAKSLGLDMERFQQDMQSEAIATTLDQSMQLVNLIQLQGTPGFFINGRQINGFDKGLLNGTLAQIRREIAQKP